MRISNVSDIYISQQAPLCFFGTRFTTHVPPFNFSQAFRQTIIIKLGRYWIVDIYMFNKNTRKRKNSLAAVDFSNKLFDKKFLRVVP